MPALSEILLRRRRNSLPEHRALDHIPVPHLEKRVHDGLHPRLVHINEEVLDCLLRRRTGGVVESLPSTQRRPATRQTPSCTAPAARQTQTLIAWSCEK